MGQNDILNAGSGGPRNNPTLNNQQWLNKLVRGRYFFDTSQATTQNMGVTFNWEKHEAAGVGHTPQLMANDALP